MISYDSYRVFYYVSKCRSFTQAARQLLTSQPNITPHDPPISNPRSAARCFCAQTTVCRSRPRVRGV